ncbi:helix-turn-helix domain-containing protein [Paenibacillus sp. KQZ6P-2]|uniref:Helix-turn-helix domain-containing protein n=1 Tax=Paenibacillus mangrovi TaxID=2931978 RepID=A0A9X2B204_9BACL|nr:helix-turn-helix domain-containing protein [Paenibacillus mangrovi]MCJ8011806.1 helix-turn-helix domain-containing protein [Paenibacillus mangrovi]
MNILPMYKSRKYLFRLLLSISVVTVIFLTVSSSLLYYTSENKMLQMQQQADLKVLSQIKYNIDNLNETVKNITVSTYMDPDVVYLLNTSVMDKGELAQKLNRLEKTVSGSMFLQSITIYNANTKCYYSTQSSIKCSDDGMNGLLSSYIKSHKEIPRLKFIPISGEQAKSPVFSMFIYEELTDSKLIVTLKPSWLFDNISNLNHVDSEQQGAIFVTDKSGTPLLETTMSTPIPLDEYREVIRNRAEAGVDQDYLIHESSGDKFILSFTSSSQSDWIIASVQPYHVVLGKLHEMRKISLMIISVVLILSIAVSFLIAYRLYRPIENMLQQMFGKRLRGVEKRSDLDELKLITNEYQDAMHKLVKLEKEEYSQRDQLKTFALRRLISDASLLTPQEIQQIQWDIDLHHKLRLCVLLIDDLENFERQSSDSDKRLYKFAIANITKEILARDLHCEIVPMQNDHFVLLLGEAHEGSSMHLDNLKGILQELQQTINAYYRISLSISIGDETKEYSQLSRQYGQVLENASYRIIYGKSCIITSDLVERNKENNGHFQFPADVEKKISESIKSGQSHKFREQLEALFHQLESLHYNNIMYSVFHLLAILNQAVGDMNNRSVRQVNLDFKYQYQQLLKQESLQAMFNMFSDIFEEIHHQRSQDFKMQSNQILIDTIKEMIEEQYEDVNLSLQSIATAMKLSSAHVSKQFRQQESMSISEYINEVRLRNALTLLENKDYSISRIMEMVGYSNESYFFKLFKKKFGTTPKEYRFKKVIEE